MELQDKCRAFEIKTAILHDWNDPLQASNGFNLP
jgi:hypothetical protein